MYLFGFTVIDERDNLQVQFRSLYFLRLQKKLWLEFISYYDKQKQCLSSLQTEIRISDGND